MIRTEFPDDVNTTQGSGTFPIRSPARVVNAGTKEELVSPRTASAILSPTSFTSGHRDWEPSLAPIPEDGSWKHNKEILHEILQHAQILRTLIAPENWPGDAISIESTSNTAELGAPQVTALSDTQGQRRVSAALIPILVDRTLITTFLFLRRSIRARLKVRQGSPIDQRVFIKRGGFF